MPAAFQRLLLILLVFSPAIFTAGLVRDKAVDVGCWDMWENAPLLQNWHDWREGRMSCGEFCHVLYSAQIQHRIVVPRLIIIALTHLSGGDFRWEVYFTFLLLILESWLLWLLVKRTLENSAWRWPLMFAVNLLLFSPIHFQNLLWGSSMWSILPLPCLLGVLVLLAAPRGQGFWWRVAAAVLLAEIATHSFAHGLALWPVIIGLVLLFDPAPWRTRLHAAAIVAVIAAATIACYFTDFVNVAHHAYDLKPGDDALKGAGRLLEGDHLKVAARFFLAFVGTWFARTPFVGHPLEAARAFGVVTLLILAALGAVLAFRRDSRRHWGAALPWLALAAYVIGVALMVSKRGADIGEHRAVTPRYLAVSQHLLMSLLALPLILGNRRSPADSQPESNAAAALSWTDLVSAALLAAFITTQIPVWQYGLHLAGVWHHARRQAQALVLFLPHLKPESLKVLDKDSKNWRCLDAINTLDRLGLLRFKPLETPELKWFTRESRPLGPEKAGISAANFREDGSLELAGNARFAVGRPADAVLVARGERVISLGQPAPRHLLRIYGLDYEFANAEEVPVAAMYPWKAVIPAAALPDDSAALELWALDVANRRISRINIRFSVDKTSAKVKFDHDA